MVKLHLESTSVLGGRRACRRTRRGLVARASRNHTLLDQQTVTTPGSFRFWSCSAQFEIGERNGQLANFNNGCARD